jgi:hypothetical protein
MSNEPTGRSIGNLDTSESHGLTDPASPPARSAKRAAGGRAGWEQGAPPSNTAPDNCNGEYFKALRWGVDSLYLSYSGELLPEVQTRLNALKEMAQSRDPEKQALAQYPVAGHTFEVKDKGARNFPFILEDGSYRIQLSKGGKVPVAYVKVSAVFLAHVGPAEAERRLYAILVELCKLESSAQVSRIDLFADFVWTGSFDWDRTAWVTRASAIDNYSESGTFTGWVIGRGGVMLARLYFKSLQAKKTGQDYLLSLWREAGRTADEPVWRLEFQIKRDVLSDMRLGDLHGTLANLSGLWAYGTGEWVRLAIPQDGDQTRSRWPLHPLWGYLSEIDWQGNGGPLLRSVDMTHAPQDPKLYSMYLAALIGFMAKRHIHDLYQAQEAMTTELVAFYSDRAYMDGISFDQYVDERVALKVRQYGSGINDPEILDKVDENASQARAEAYRKASRGS